MASEGTGCGEGVAKVQFVSVEMFAAVEYSGVQTPS
jgi:hypothetical protein